MNMKPLSKNAEAVIVEAAIRALLSCKPSRFTDEPSYRQGILALLDNIDDMAFEELKKGRLTDIKRRTFNAELSRRITE